MKNLSLLIFFALLFASCSSDEPVAPMTVENAYFDKAYSTALINGKADAVFQWKEVRLYDQNSLTNGSWKEVDLTEYLGWSPSQPGVMIFEDGKLYTEYTEIFNLSSGPSALCRVWAVYEYATGQDFSLFLARAFRIDDDDNTIEISRHGLSSIVGLSSGGFILEQISRYEGGESGNGGWHKEVTVYGAVKKENLDKNILSYETEQELVKAVIERVRSKFGDVVNLNSVYSGTIIFDRPDKQIYNLDEIAASYGVIAD